jgi:hypothetical protein
MDLSLSRQTKQTEASQTQTKVKVVLGMKAKGSDQAKCRRAGSRFP